MTSGILEMESSISAPMADNNATTVHPFAILTM
jgi:hypothetical protein